MESIRSETLSEIMLSYTSLGSTPLGVVGLVFLYYFADFQVFTTLGAAVLATVVIVQSLKEIVDRERPDVQLCIPSFSSSFPSGHSSNAFTYAITLSYFYSGFTAVFLFFAFLVAFSRVYLGEHYPTDVIAGSIIGTTVGFAAITII